MDATFLQILWYILIFVLIGGYFVLDGFDLGAGVLYPLVAKNDKEKAIVRRSIGPVWDGNEVWLLTAGGALFAAFPPAYATTFSGFYLAIMLVLFSLIIRAVSIEFRSHDAAWGKLWDVCFVIGSFLPALLFGVAVGNIFQGIPLNANGDYTGMPLFGLITPFTLLCGVLGLALFLSQGVTWLARKAPLKTALYSRVSTLRMPLQVAVLVLFLVVTIYVFAILNPTMDGALGWLRYLFAGVFVIALIASLVFGARKSDLAAFICQSVSIVAIVGLLASSMFPNLVVAAAGSATQSLTLMNSSSSELALAWMTGIACIGVPLVLVYHVIIYRTFRGRIADEDLQ